MKLGDVCTKIGSGATPRGGKEAYKDSGIPIIRSQNVLDWSFTSNGLAFIDDAQAAALANVEVKPCDILLNITGDSVARACMVPNWCTPARVNQHVSIVRPGPELDPTFLLCFLQSSKPLLLKLASSGATRNALTKGMIEDLDIELPSIDSQRAIASLIGQMQQKIALNQQANDYLEALGSTLVERYTACCDETILLKELLDFGNGFAFKSGTYVDNGKYKVLTNKNVQDGNVDCSGANRINEMPDRMKEFCRLNLGDVVLSLTGNVGRVGIVSEPDCLLNQRVAVFLPIAEQSLAGLYFWFRQDSFKDRMIGIARGTAQANLSTIETLQLEIPFNKDGFVELCADAQALFEAILANKKEILLLSNLRDTLLPKLMSGEIDVSEVELPTLPNNHLHTD